VGWLFASLYQTMQQDDPGLAFGPPPSMQAMAQASSLPEMSPEILMAASKVGAARVRFV
jgi:hypothetical protein